MAELVDENPSRDASGPIRQHHRSLSRCDERHEDQLSREEAIMDGYIDFRFALKEAEVLAAELLDMHGPTLTQAQQALADAQTAIDDFPAKMRTQSRLVQRDEARQKFEERTAHFNC
ncbi:MAG: hypothetical protein R3C05_30145 [Pirellulaceae bacterium]